MANMYVQYCRKRAVCCGTITIFCSMQQKIFSLLNCRQNRRCYDENFVGKFCVLSGFFCCAYVGIKTKVRCSSRWRNKHWSSGPDLLTTKKFSIKCAASCKRISKNVILQETVEDVSWNVPIQRRSEVKWNTKLMHALTSSLIQNMEVRGKTLIRVCANTKGAFTRL